MRSGESVRVIRDMSDKADLLILLVPSLRLITRGASPLITASGRGNTSLSWNWLNAPAIFLCVRERESAMPSDVFAH